MEDNNADAKAQPETKTINNIKHDIFEDPAISRALKEDPILRWLFSHLREFVVTIAAVFSAWFVWHRFQETYYSSLSDAGQEYVRVSSSYEAYANQLTQQEKAGESASTQTEESKEAEKNPQADKIKEERRKLGESLLALGDAKSPYNQLAGVYGGLLASMDGSTMRAKEVLGSDDWSSIALNKPSERFVAELRSLVLARVLVDDEKELARAKDLLLGLAKGGHYVNVMAAVTLARIVSTGEERKQVADILQQIAATQPEQAEVVKEELDRLKA